MTSKENRGIFDTTDLEKELKKGRDWVIDTSTAKKINVFAEDFVIKTIKEYRQRLKAEVEKILDGWFDEEETSVQLPLRIYWELKKRLGIK